MNIYRVYEKEILEDGSFKTIGEKFYSLERLVDFLDKKKAYYKFINEPITKESILENITDTYCTDIIIPKDTNESIWEMMGFPNEDTLLWIVKLKIEQ